MKSLWIKRKGLLFLPLLMLLSITCNYFFQSVEQPFSADPYSTFEVKIAVSLEAEERGGIPYFGICLPNGWTVKDSISYSGALSGRLIYSKEMSDSMETINNTADGYYWWVSVEGKWVY